MLALDFRTYLVMDQNNSWAGFWAWPTCSVTWLRRRNHQKWSKQGNDLIPFVSGLGSHGKQGGERCSTGSGWVRKMREGESFPIWGREFVFGKNKDNTQTVRIRTSFKPPNWLKHKCICILNLYVCLNQFIVYIYANIYILSLVAAMQFCNGTFLCSKVMSKITDLSV